MNVSKNNNITKQKLDAVENNIQLGSPSEHHLTSNHLTSNKNMRDNNTYAFEKKNSAWISISIGNSTSASSSEYFKPKYAG